MKIISIDELQCKKTLVVDELKSQSIFEDSDLNSISMHIKGKSHPPFIVDVDKAIKSLERYYTCNKHLIKTFNSEQIIRRKQLAKMLDISCPTLNKWIFHGFIQPIQLKCMQGETFPVQDVLKQLFLYRKKKRPEPFTHTTFYILSYHLL